MSGQVRMVDFLFVVSCEIRKTTKYFSMNLSLQLYLAQFEYLITDKLIWKKDHLKKLKKYSKNDKIIFWRNPNRYSILRFKYVYFLISLRQFNKIIR